MCIRFLEQFTRVKTKGERKNVWSIFLLLKPKYIKDLTLEFSDLKKKTRITNGKTLQHNKY
jgi:hypothetical protein